jgi:hypothetical protein
MLEARLDERCHRTCGTPQQSRVGVGEEKAHDTSYWRSEILQALFWLKGEGFGDKIEVALLERFLGGDAFIGVRYLGRLVDEGYLEHDGDRYRLSAAGAREGEREFVASFEDLFKPSRCTCSWEA